MKYEYICQECGFNRVVDKPMLQSGKEEFCDKCSSQRPLKRIYGATGIKTGDGFKGGK